MCFNACLHLSDWNNIINARLKNVLLVTHTSMHLCWKSRQIYLTEWQVLTEAHACTHTKRGNDIKPGLQWQLPSVGLRVSSWVLECIISLCRQAYYCQHIYTYVPAQQHVINTEWWVLCWSVSAGVIMKSEVWANPLIRNVSYQRLFIITHTHTHTSKYLTYSLL